MKNIIAYINPTITIVILDLIGNLGLILDNKIRLIDMLSGEHFRI